MTPRELIQVLLKNLNRRSVMLSLPECERVYEISPQMFLFKSKEDYERENGRDTCPLILMGEWNEPKEENKS